MHCKAAPLRNRKNKHTPPSGQSAVLGTSPRDDCSKNDKVGGGEESGRNDRCAMGDSEFMSNRIGSTEIKVRNEVLTVTGRNNVLIRFARTKRIEIAIRGARTRCAHDLIKRCKSFRASQFGLRLDRDESGLQRHRNGPTS